MKIPFGNQKLEIKLCFSIRPNLKKLEEELKDFFSKKEIEGHKIEKFRIEATPGETSYRIVPLEPHLEECLSAKGDYEKELKEIGEDYGIKDFGFIYFCYHK